jgi:hypothetical protein
MSPLEIEELTLWQYTAVVEEHNIRSNTDIVVEAPTAEDYQKDLEVLRARGDPSIQV